MLKMALKRGGYETGIEIEKSWSYDNPSHGNCLYLRPNLPFSSRHRESPPQVGTGNLAETPRCYRIERTGMWEQDQTDLPNKSLTGNFRRPL